MRTTSADHADERLLLAAAQAGDERAFRRLVDPYRHALEVHSCLDELERRPRRPEPVQPYPAAASDPAAAPTHDPAARYAC
jgi:RNA polymerase sigma-70 factor, ECF subfamily